MTLLKVDQPVIGPTAYRKNVIINGDFKVWQRGTTLAGINSGMGIKMVADRFAVGTSSDAVLTASKTAPGPSFAVSGRYWPGGLYVSTTTADVSIGAGQFGEVIYRVEGYDLIPFLGRVCTLSFWSAATKTGVYCVALRNNLAGPDRSYVFEYTQAVASTWQFNQFTFTMHDAQTGTWDLTNGMGLDIWFMICCGSTYQTTPNGWRTGNYLATSNQVNGFDTIGNNFWLTGVQLELGPVATAFENRSFGEELALCQRYYLPATAAVGMADASTTADLLVTFPQEMRITPIVGTPATNLSVWDGQVGTFTQSSPSASNIVSATTKCMGVRCGNFTGMTAGRALFLSGGIIPLDSEF